MHGESMQVWCSRRGSHLCKSAESAVVLRSEATTRVTLTFNCTAFRIFLRHEPQLIIPLYGIVWKLLSMIKSTERSNFL